MEFPSPDGIACAGTPNAALFPNIARSIIMTLAIENLPIFLGATKLFLRSTQK